MIRPSLFLARIPQPDGHSLQVDAYHRAVPVTMSSAEWIMEERVLSGLDVQPAAMERLPVPASFRKVRRFISELHSQN